MASKGDLVHAKRICQAPGVRLALQAPYLRADGEASHCYMQVRRGRGGGGGGRGALGANVCGVGTGEEASLCYMQVGRGGRVRGWRGGGHWE